MTSRAPGDGSPCRAIRERAYPLPPTRPRSPGFDPVEGKGEGHEIGNTSITFWNLVTTIHFSTSVRKRAHDGARTNSSRKGNFAAYAATPRAPLFSGQFDGPPEPRGCQGPRGNRSLVAAVVDEQGHRLSALRFSNLRVARGRGKQDPAGIEGAAKETRLLYGALSGPTWRGRQASGPAASPRARAQGFQVFLI